jgi:GT2 family glycosyltransferase
VSRAQTPLSVVIPTHGRRERLERCVRSIAAQLPPNAEIVVSDDGSPDDTRERVEQWAREDPRIRLIAGSQTGPAGARNRGWRAACGEIIAFIDDDCVAEPGWCAALVAALDANASWAAVEGATEPEGEAPGFGYHSIRAGAGSYLTCNLAVRRTALAAIGGFDERFPYPHCEDLDLCLRILRDVGEIGFAPAARVQHMVVYVGATYPLRRTRLDASTYRLFALHPRRFAGSWALLKLPLFPRVGEGRPPRPWQIFAYIVGTKMAHAYFAARDGRHLRERVIGSAIHLASAVLSVTQIRPGQREYQRALKEG